MKNEPLRIAFTADKHGHPVAYRLSMWQMRWFRIGYDAARLLVATERAEEVPYRKWSD